MRSVNLGRWSRWIERYFNVKGGGGLMDVEQTIRAVLSIQSGNEDRYLQGWDRFAQGANVAAAAANNSGFRIRNPAGSNVVAVIEKCVASEGANDFTAFRFSSAGVTADLGTVLVPGINRLDPRSRNAATCIVSDQNTAVGVPALSANQFTVDANQHLASTPYSPILTVNNEVLLMPGAGYQIEAVAVNTALNVFLEWRERSLETSELT